MVVKPYTAYFVSFCVCVYYNNSRNHHLLYCLLITFYFLASELKNPRIAILAVTQDTTNSRKQTRQPLFQEVSAYWKAVS